MGAINCSQTYEESGLPNQFAFQVVEYDSETIKKTPLNSQAIQNKGAWTFQNGSSGEDNPSFFKLASPAAASRYGCQKRPRSLSNCSTADSGQTKSPSILPGVQCRQPRSPAKANSPQTVLCPAELEDGTSKMTPGDLGLSPRHDFTGNLASEVVAGPRHSRACSRGLFCDTDEVDTRVEVGTPDGGVQTQKPQYCEGPSASLHPAVHPILTAMLGPCKPSTSDTGSPPNFLMCPGPCPKRFAQKENIEVCRERSLSAAPSPKRIKGDHADFTGSWLCHRAEGDLETLLEELGVGYFVRQTAKTFDYGAGRASWTIEQTGDRFTIWVTALSTVKVEFVVGDGEQTTEGEYQPRRVIPRWGECYTLCLDCCELDGSGQVKERIYLDGEELAVERRTDNHTTATWYYREVQAA